MDGILSVLGDLNTVMEFVINVATAVTLCKVLLKRK